VVLSIGLLAPAQPRFSRQFGALMCIDDAATSRVDSHLQAWPSKDGNGDGRHDAGGNGSQAAPGDDVEYKLSPSRGLHQPPTPDLQAGLSHMWTTPILLYPLIRTAESPLLRALALAVLRRFREFCEASDPTAPVAEGESPNDRFFVHQLDEWEAGRPSFLEDVRGYGRLQSAWLGAIRAFVTSAASDEVADAMLAEASGARLFVWASVHEGESAHEPHDHENAAVSGVFYVRAAPTYSLRGYAHRTTPPRELRPPTGCTPPCGAGLYTNARRGHLLRRPPRCSAVLGRLAILARTAAALPERRRAAALPSVAGAQRALVGRRERAACFDQFQPSHRT
jgi:hypothetical protein